MDIALSPSPEVKISFLFVGHVDLFSYRRPMFEAEMPIFWGMGMRCGSSKSFPVDIAPCLISHI
jgi:hypothetical protein